ncbi:OmpP1/FadL family transporter [Pseudomonas viridiflava]|jgi:Long-chain fatty acid transport protein|uniref:OmpP1/FadL family transporter n=1 Tax=Pseudomonas viridiflava TaxID=33069 RepID=UPI000F021301|nr:outer membrane protein transport protein [Pseudomonas viridiflava]MEE3916528.1 outer membrane protein transport protein [Pseudomonas viridiflava]MEE3972846.1 outer membrane protein transport protein [Pseudomonas viridiflava]MEE4018122.1 outer membrane protein transport protein [Pseudomonas viridiflava]MEE4046606.1 outer membrane protein transport protein [Pseudomonas viridiflava]
MQKITLGFTFAVVSTQLCAGGFGLNEQSISGMGTAFAGRASSADDASTVYGNPAGMARLQGQQITGGVTFIDASSDISNPSGRSTGTNKGDMVPFKAIPFGFYTYKPNEQWAFGMGVYAPFGLATDYESGFQGRAFASRSDARVITLQPTVSYAFNDRVSIGFGPTINRLAGELESDLTLNPAIPDTNVKVKGDDVALGFNVGILANLTDTTRAGMTYHSRVRYDLDCHTAVATGAGTPPQVLRSNRYDCSLQLDTPESVDLSVTQDLSDAWKLYAGATWTRWSRMKDLDFSTQSISPAVGGVLASSLSNAVAGGLDWHDTWAYALGTSYRLNAQWLLRTGIRFDQSPTSNTNRSPRTPTGDRTIYSVGAAYDLTKDLTLDVAYSWLKEESVNVSRSNALASYSARYENSASFLGLGATYRF